MPKTIPFNLAISAEDFIDRATAAQMLGFSERQLMRLHQLRIGPPIIRVQRRVYYHKPSILLWLFEKQRENAGPHPYRPRKKKQESVPALQA